MAGPEALADLRRTIDGFLQASFEDVHADRVGDFFVRTPEVTTWIQVRALAEDQTAVLVWSPSAIGMAVDEKLATYLATEANGLAFGQLELHRVPTPRLHVSHALLGEYLSREELVVAVEAVAEASARYGPLVKEHFGGRLAREHEIVAGRPNPVLEEIAEVVERTGQWPPPPDEADDEPASAPRTPPERTATEPAPEPAGDPPEVAELRDRIRGYLETTVVGAQTDAEGDFVVPYDETVTFVRPVPWRENRTLARVWSVTNVGVDDTDGGVAAYLLMANAQIVFGGFRLDPAPPAVVLAHTLLGEYLNRAELMTALAAVATTADVYARDIKARYGGQLFTEA